MNIILTQVEGFEAEASTRGHGRFMNITLIGVQPEEASSLLSNLCIKDAIEYYGQTEILDFIGMDSVLDYVDSNSQEEEG